MEAIGTADRVAPIARSPLDSARGRRKRSGPVIKSGLVESPGQEYRGPQ